MRDTKQKSRNIVSAFYKSILKHKWKIPRRKKVKRFTYEVIKEKIDSEKFFFVSIEKANELSENDVEKCHNHFHGINIKLTKCSGITPARRMISKAREWRIWRVAANNYMARRRTFQRILLKPRNLVGVRPKNKKADTVLLS